MQQKMRIRNIKWGAGLVSGTVFVVLAVLQAFGVNPLDNYMTGLANAIQLPAVTGFFRFITMFGQSYFFTGLSITVLLASRFRRWGVFFSFGALAAALCNQLLKFFFRRARPAVEWMTSASGYSFPSGHAMGAMAIYGFAIYLIWKSGWPARIRKVITATLATLILLVGISRVILKVHHFTDVVAGWAAGFLYLLGLIALYKRFQKKPKKHK